MNLVARPNSERAEHDGANEHERRAKRDYAK